jgi:glucose-6-phosphate 1-dehydrogenase
MQEVDAKQNAIVIFGASGDLAKRKLLPALNVLYKKGIIDDSNVIVGSGRSAFSDQEFRKHFDLPSSFSKRLFYYQGIAGLKKYLEKKGNFKKVVFFFSLPPMVYGKTAKALVEEGFGEEASIIIEKPFGYDYETARALNTEINQYFEESRVYRIDHYLAKEAVQNIMVFRFANSIFEPLWNNHYIESIQINAFEEIGLEGRAAYFDGSGIMRDMMQNHLMQLLCLLTMEAPVSLDAADIRAQKTNVLRNMKIKESYRYQYKGYREEEGVAKDSNTSTFAEIEIGINNFRWMGVPIYMRTGKALNCKATEIGIKFRPMPNLLFNEEKKIDANQIIIQVQPDESILLDVSSKVPGDGNKIVHTNMNFYYHEIFQEEVPEAYQKLLMDALHGDQTLFVSAEETETSWKLFDPVIGKGDLQFYEKGHVPETSLDTSLIDFEKYRKC